MAEDEEQQRRPDPGEREPAPGQEVMSSLPHRRPQRRSTKRGASPRTRAGAGSAGATGRDGASGAPQAATGAGDGTGTGAGTGAGSRRGGRAAANARAKPSGPAQSRGAARQPQTRAGGTEAKTRGGPRQPLIKGPAATRRQPRRPAGAGTPVRSPSPIDPPTGTEIVGAAVHVAGELAQAGLSLGGRVLRSALRLPRL